MIRADLSPVAPSMARVHCVESMADKTSHGICDQCADIFTAAGKTQPLGVAADHGAGGGDPFSSGSERAGTVDTRGARVSAHVSKTSPASATGPLDSLSSAIGAQSSKCDEADDINGASPRPALDYL